MLVVGRPDAESGSMQSSPGQEVPLVAEEPQVAVQIGPELRTLAAKVTHGRTTHRRWRASRAGRRRPATGGAPVATEARRSAPAPSLGAEAVPPPGTASGSQAVELKPECRPRGRSLQGGAVAPFALPAYALPVGPGAIRTALSPGYPYPLGATWDGSGTNFAVFSQSARRSRIVPVRPGGNRDPLTSCPKSTPTSGTGTWRNPNPASSTATGYTGLTTPAEACGQTTPSSCSTRTPRPVAGEVRWGQAVYGYLLADQDDRLHRLDRLGGFDAQVDRCRHRIRLG